MKTISVIFVMCFAVFVWSFYVEDRTPKTWPKALREKLGAPEYETVDKTKPLDEQVAIVEIGGRTFAIPKVYIQTNLRGRRKVTGLNLVYVMPDFTSNADFKNKEEYREAFNNRRMAHMLIKDLPTVTPIMEIVKNKEKHGHLTRFEGIEYGLEKHIDFNDPRHLNIKFDDVYLEKDESGQVVSFIECSPHGEVRFPGCSPDFDDKGLRYSIYFNKAKYFSTWRDHRRKAIAFIDSFEIHPETYNTKEKEITP